jgi:hypothetical protein
MFQTAFTLTLTQFARTLSLPERVQKTPARNFALEALRQRNTALDGLFYDVKVITPDEAFYISDSLAAEGSIMIVPPSGCGSLTLCDTLEEFALRGGRDVHALAVAGVGGSALGAAAFARNVADAVEGPVAVVVSGYGLADIVTESFGGHFLFGHLRGLRPVFEALDDFAGRPKFGVADKGVDSGQSRTCLDTKTVSALLADPRLSFDLLVAHSKGNLVLSAALHALAQRDPARTAELAEGTTIITFGARIAMPPVFADVIDVIGAWDWFGEMNSRPYISTDRRVPNAGHHTNTELPGHLPVTATLREILAAKRPAEERAEAAAGAQYSDLVPGEDVSIASRPGAVRKPASRKAKTGPADEILSQVTALESMREIPPDQPKPH